MSEQHTITALVQNEAGTINRLVSLFRRRGFSLGSFNAGDCEDPGYSRLTLVVNGDQTTMSQCVKQLDKLIDVVEVQDLPPQQSVRRELALIRVDVPSGARTEVIEIVRALGGKVSHLNASAVTVEFVDEPYKIDHLIEMLRPYGVGEVVRTGLVAMRVAS